MLLEEIDLEQQAMNTVFSIHVAENALFSAESKFRGAAEINAG
jgi:hypothetical protein